MEIMLTLVLAFNLLLHTIVEPVDSRDRLHGRFSEIPLHNEEISEFHRGAERAENTEELKHKIHDEVVMKQLVKDTSKAIMNMIKSEDFENILIERGSAVLTWEDDPPVKVLKINLQMARDPFLIAEALVNVIRKWYCHQVNVNPHKVLHLQLSKFAELSYLLTEIRDYPNSESFTRLYYALRQLFPLSTNKPKEMDSPYFLFYSWLYYHEKCRWMSKGTLDIISVLGEGSQSIVWKVQGREGVDSKNNSEGMNGQQIFALKMYKDHLERRHCRNEERILNRIGYAQWQTGVEIAVPAIYPMINGLAINCNQHHTIAMQFIEGRTISDLPNSAFSVDTVVGMYSQLLEINQALAEIGIGHGDVKEDNVIYDEKQGQYYLFDFGFSFSMDDYLTMELDPKSKKDLQTSTIGTWLMYSPQLMTLNHYMHSEQRNVSRHNEGIRALLLDGNVYSTQALILKLMVWSERMDDVTEKLWGKMRATHDEIEKIHKSDDPNKFALMRRPLINIWSMREAILKQFTLNHPELEMYLESSLFSKIRIDWASI